MSKNIILVPKTWHFDLYQRPSSEEAGTQFFQFLIRWENAISESQSVWQDGSKRPYTSERKDNRPWTVMRAATNWATQTTTFLTRRLPVVLKQHQCQKIKSDVILHFSQILVQQHLMLPQTFPSTQRVLFLPGYWRPANWPAPGGSDPLQASQTRSRRVRPAFESETCLTRAVAENPLEMADC